MGQGANFATSPGRIETHTFDPAITAIKVATTSQSKLVDFDQFIKYIERETNNKIAYLGIGRKVNDILSYDSNKHSN